MKKSVGFIALAAFVLAAVVLNVVLFLTVPAGRTSEGMFWFIWAFTFPLNLLIAICALFYLMRKSTDLIIHVPIVLTVTVVGFIAYVFAAYKLIYSNIIKDTVTNVVTGTSAKINSTAAIITEVTITAVYILVILVSLLVLAYIEGNQKLTKKKVLFIRLLKADIEGCVPYVSDPAIVKELNKLAEKVRFSDPMSHSSLESCESEMTSLVADISMKARTGENEAVLEIINKVNILLDYRNERCKILK